MKKNKIRKVILGFCSVAIAVLWMNHSFYVANAAMMPGPRHTCLDSKTEEYQSSGFFACGDKRVTSTKLKDIRRALSPNGYERIVFELDNMGQDASVIPYFQVQLAPESGKLIVSLWTDVNYHFNQKKVTRNFSKSRVIELLNVVPRVEEDLATFEIKFKKKGSSAPKTEAFYLTNPPRIILDIL